ncbi:MAG: class I SAM-dependent rRNA methyltransferase [Planctomycetes bacterium]|nr:class I SAM-dependent rRNA methyltransferase [Planctomycetota bacterium]
MSNLMGLPVATAHLKPRKAKPFFYRHPWVFSGAIDRIDGEWSDGDLVRLADDKGQYIATGYINSQSQIMIRLLTWDEAQVVDEQFFREKIQRARDLRENILSVQTGTSAFRLFYSESDGIPGLVVDKYAGYLVVQIQSLGIHIRREAIIDILSETFAPEGIFEKSDPEMLAREGVESEAGVVRGSQPPEPLRIECDTLAFDINIRAGQKTGFYLDQRENRKVAAWYASDRRVLDCFCHTGGFSLYASKLGRARSVLGIDSSAPAIEVAQHNATLNDLHNVEFRTGNLPEAIKELRDAGQLFDMVILDPPQFAKSKASVARAVFGYRQLNAQALRCIEPGGILVTCSCSQHLSQEAFEHMLNEAAFEAGRSVQVIERRSQSPDHPVMISCPQSRYLKCFICRVS